MEESRLAEDEELFVANETIERHSAGAILYNVYECSNCQIRRTKISFCHRKRSQRTTPFVILILIIGIQQNYNDSLCTTLHSGRQNATNTSVSDAQAHHRISNDTITSHPIAFDAISHTDSAPFQSSPMLIMFVDLIDDLALDRTGHHRAKWWTEGRIRRKRDSSDDSDDFELLNGQKNGTHRFAPKLNVTHMRMARREADLERLPRRKKRAPRRRAQPAIISQSLGLTDEVEPDAIDQAPHAESIGVMHDDTLDSPRPLLVLPEQASLHSGPIDDASDAMSFANGSDAAAAAAHQQLAGRKSANLIVSEVPRANSIDRSSNLPPPTATPTEQAQVADPQVGDIQALMEAHRIARAHNSPTQPSQQVPADNNNNNGHVRNSAGLELLNQQKKLAQLMRLYENEQPNKAARQKQQQAQRNPSKQVSVEQNEDPRPSLLGAPYATMTTVSPSDSAPIMQHSSLPQSSNDQQTANDLYQENDPLPASNSSSSSNSINMTPERLAYLTSKIPHYNAYLASLQQQQQSRIMNTPAALSSKGSNQYLPDRLLEDNFYANQNQLVKELHKKSAPNKQSTPTANGKLRESGSRNHANVVAASNQPMSVVSVPNSYRPESAIDPNADIYATQQQQQQQLLANSAVANRLLYGANLVQPSNLLQQQLYYSMLPNLAYLGSGSNHMKRQSASPLLFTNQRATNPFAFAAAPMTAYTAAAALQQGSSHHLTPMSTTARYQTAPTTAKSSTKRQMLAGASQTSRYGKSQTGTSYDDSLSNSQSSSGGSDPMWSDTQNQDDEYQQSPQTIQITAVPNGLAGVNGWNGAAGYGLNPWNAWGGPWNGRQVLLVNRQPTTGVGSEWRQWALPIAIILALPLILGALFVPVFLKSVMFLIQILQMLGLLMPPGQLAGHLSASAHGSGSSG